MSKKTKIILTILTLVIAFMDISGLPGVALVSCKVADVDPYILPLIVNFCFIGLLAFIVLKVSHIEYRFGFTKEGLKAGLKSYAWIGILVGVLFCIAFCVGLYPFDHKPTIWKILLEGVIYYIGVGIVEEFYVRGLFLNILEELFAKNNKKTEVAIFISSVVFGVGHIPGMIEMGTLVIIMKLISTVGLGLYLGVIYKRSKNLWVSILMHIFINVCALPYCFTNNMRYEKNTLIILIITSLLLSIYSLMIMKKSKDNE